MCRQQGRNNTFAPVNTFFPETKVRSNVKSCLYPWPLCCSRVREVHDMGPSFGVFGVAVAGAGAVDGRLGMAIAAAWRNRM